MLRYLSATDAVYINPDVSAGQFNSLISNMELPSYPNLGKSLFGGFLTFISSNSKLDSTENFGKSVYETPVFWMYVLICVLLVAFAGIASGLTAGLMSIDQIQLLVLAETGNDEDRKRAWNVYQLVRKHHLILVTLLLANSLAMEALPIFLDRLVPSWLAIALSATLILFFGEVLPQALCTGRNQLAIASFMVPIVQALLILFFVLAWPISRALDLAFGREDDVYYGRSHLKALIGLHQKGRRHRDVAYMATSTDALSSKKSSGLGADEVVVIQGALDMADKRVFDIMVKLPKVYMLEINTSLTPEVLQEILHTGHSRIPVYEGSRHNIRGLLLVKSLIMVDPTAGIPVSEVIKNTEIRRLCTPAFASPDYNPYELLNDFQEGHTHIALVTEDFEEYQQAWQENRDVTSSARILGIVTLEDVIEELIQEEILDEFDHTYFLQPKKIFSSKGNSSYNLRPSWSSLKRFNSANNYYGSLNHHKCGKRVKKKFKRCIQDENATVADVFDDVTLNALNADTYVENNKQIVTLRSLSISNCPKSCNVYSSKKYNSLLNEYELLKNERLIKSSNFCTEKIPLDINMRKNLLLNNQNNVKKMEESYIKFMSNSHDASFKPLLLSSSLLPIESSDCNDIRENYCKFSFPKSSDLVSNFLKWSKTPFRTIKNCFELHNSIKVNNADFGIKRKGSQFLSLNENEQNENISPYRLFSNEEEHDDNNRNNA